MGSVSTSIRGVRFTLYILGGNEWFRFPRHSVSGSTLLGLTWDLWCGKGTAPGCAWCLRGAMLLRGFRLFGVALHREPKGTKRFSHWEINHEKFASRVLYQLPAHYVPEATLQQNVQDRDFPSRRVRKKPPQADVDEFKAKCSELRQLATAQELSNPVSFALEIVGLLPSNLTSNTFLSTLHSV